jgi:hypothetical protein
MTWWQTAAVSISSSALGGILAVAGSYFLASRHRRAQEREDAIRSVGAVLSALRELDPSTWGDRIAYRREADAHEALEIAAAKRARWLVAADRLEVLGALHPDSRIAELVETVADRGNLVSIRLDEVAHGARVDDMWQKVIPAVHAEALESARELVRLVR